MTADSPKLKRRADVHETRVDEDSFLVVPETEAIFHLNALGRALWNVLAESRTPREIRDLLAIAFPTMSPADIDRDVHHFLLEMEAAGLIRQDDRP